MYIAIFCLPPAKCYLSAATIMKHWLSSLYMLDVVVLSLL